MLELEIEVDSFAGGGGASEGIFKALGRPPALAINHEPKAIAMHAANHPNTKHITENIWKIDPIIATEGKPVGALWASPDCTHFSSAKGAKPVKKEIRGLAWVVIRWAGAVRPRVIFLENVREFESWGPLIHQKIKGKLQYEEDGSPTLVPDPTRKGRSFKQWVGRLRGLGYEVQWRVLNAADYGAPTSRKRLFLIARCDGEPIVWPEATHADPAKIPAGSKLLPWRPAADCIDWSIPCPSIFERKKPLAENTLKRIALGIKRYVLDNPQPFLVQVNHGHDEFRGQDLGRPLPTVSTKHGYGVVSPVVTRLSQTKGKGKYNNSVKEPLGTIVSKNEHLLVVPHVTKFRKGSKGSNITAPMPTVTSGAGAKRPAGAAHALGVVAATMAQVGYGERDGQTPRALDIESPLGTVVAGGGKHALVSAFLAKHFGGAVGQPMTRPASTVTAIDHHSLVAANLVHLKRNTRPTGCDEPARTVMAGGNHAYLVYSFLDKYFGKSAPADINRPLSTATTKDRCGVVLVYIGGEPWVIVDIGMRMLTPRELARAQGFPDSYILSGSKSSQVARLGNSVPPIMPEVLIRANYRPRRAQQYARTA